MNPLNMQWFYRGFRKTLRNSMPKDRAEKIWNEAGAAFKRILSAQPELKRHKGAMVLPAVALYRALAANGEDAEALLSSYGEYMGKRFARIVHGFTSLPGVDRYIWNHAESAAARMSSEKKDTDGNWFPSRPICTAWTFFPARTMSWQENWAMRKPYSSSVIWIRSTPKGSGISATTATRLFPRVQEPVSTGFVSSPKNHKKSEGVNDGTIWFW